MTLFDPGHKTRRESGWLKIQGIKFSGDARVRQLVKVKGMKMGMSMGAAQRRRMRARDKEDTLIGRSQGREEQLAFHQGDGSPRPRPLRPSQLPSTRCLVKTS